MDIKNIIDELIATNNTDDPIIIAENMGINVFYEHLEDINGYYSTAFGKQFIHLNRKLKGEKLKLTAAHELGHAILHPNTNTPFMRKHTYFSINRFEIEANTFAVNLLIPDNELIEYQREKFTTQQIAGIYNLPEELISLRIYGTMNC
jgi:Predicted Zn peptidase